MGKLENVPEWLETRAHGGRQEVGGEMLGGTRPTLALVSSSRGTCHHWGRALSQRDWRAPHSNAAQRTDRLTFRRGGQQPNLTEPRSRGATHAPPDPGRWLPSLPWPTDFDRVLWGPLKCS